MPIEVPAARRLAVREMLVELRDAAVAPGRSDHLPSGA
jgi:hypothetical protein